VAFNVPLFAFGSFITLLVVIGVLLALAEFRQMHATARHDEEDAGHVNTSES
jgi:hypothetical protein